MKIPSILMLHTSQQKRKKKEKMIEKLNFPSLVIYGWAEKEFFIFFSLSKQSNLHLSCD